MRQDNACIWIRRTIGNNIALLRKERQLSQCELAKRAGIDNSYLCRMENGTANFSLDKLVSCAQAMDVPVVELLRGLDTLTPREYEERSTYHYAGVRYLSK